MPTERALAVHHSLLNAPAHLSAPPAARTRVVFADSAALLRTRWRNPNPRPLPATGHASLPTTPSYVRVPGHQNSRELHDLPRRAHTNCSDDLDPPNHRAAGHRSRRAPNNDRQGREATCSRRSPSPWTIRRNTPAAPDGAPHNKSPAPPPRAEKSEARAGLSASAGSSPTRTGEYSTPASAPWSCARCCHRAATPYAKRQRIQEWHALRRSMPPAAECCDRPAPIPHARSSRDREAACA